MKSRFLEDAAKSSFSAEKKNNVKVISGSVVSGANSGSVVSGLASPPPSPSRRRSSGRETAPDGVRSGVAKEMQLALLRDAEEREKNIRRTPVDIPLEGARRGRLRAKEAFEKGIVDREEDQDQEEDGQHDRRLFLGERG